MKLSTETAVQKLRGGFYTPEDLVIRCLDRLQSLDGHHSGDLLEPSAGDGAFVRGLAKHRLAASVRHCLAIELLKDEAAKCRIEAITAPFDARVHAGSFLEWYLSNDSYFDLAIGNPPFVRYQFIDQAETQRIGRVGERLGISFQGVSNLWIPILLAALSRLKPGGTMAFIVPAELFTGVSAGVARRWLLEHFEELRVDLFDSGSFPDVLQEVIVISGRRLPASRGVESSARIDFVEHCSFGRLTWRHNARITGRNWTPYLLDEKQLRTVEDTRKLAGISKLGELARIEVSTVTGANAFFSLSSSEVEQSRLSEWVLPLLARVRYAQGIEYASPDHADLAKSDAKAWFLYFDGRLRDPMDDLFAKAYLQNGEKQGLHLRYKTSIRSPWYRVPLVLPSKLMLSKRSHTFPRLMLNSAGAVTTDTVYQGEMLPIYAGRERDLIAGFHNSLTLVDAELEGRSFGGGVLELVPSEVARLSVPLVVGFREHFKELDELYRSFGAGKVQEEELVERTNAKLSDQVPGLSPGILSDLDESRRHLQRRRLNRNR